MTPADHANTVREGLNKAAFGSAHTSDYNEALAALDVLQAQADERDAYAKQSEEQAVESGKWRQRAEAAEAEAKRLQKIERNNVVVFDKLKAAEAGRDRLRDALTQIVRAYDFDEEGDVQAYALADRARAALAGEDTPPPRPRIDKPPATEPRGI